MPKSLTYKQYCSLVIISSTVINFVVMPFISTSIISVVLGLILSYCLFCFFIKIKGKLNSRLISYVISLKYIVISGILIAMYSKIVQHLFGESINSYAIMTLTFIVGAYCGCKDSSVFKVSRILYIFVLIPFLLIIFFSFGSINLQNIIYNLKNTDGIEIISIGLLCFLFEIPVLLSSCCSFKLTIKKYSLAYIISAVFILLPYICVIGRFGKNLSNYKYAALELIYSLKLPVYFLQRQEGLLISLILMGFMVIISLGVLFSTQATDRLKIKYIILFVIYVLSILCFNVKSIINFYIIINTILSAIILIMLFAVGGKK